MVNDRHRNGRGGGVPIVAVYQSGNPVTGQDLERGQLRWAAKCVSVLANVDRPANLLADSVFHNCLGDCGDMVFVKRSVKRSSAVTAGAECHLLLHDVYVWVNRVVVRDQRIDVD